VLEDRSAPGRITLFQLQVLASVIRYGDFARAAAELGVADKHRLIKAVERLSENLGAGDLHRRIGDQPVGLRSLGAEADELLGAIRRFELGAAELGGRPVQVRCTAYPMAITAFVASAVQRFEDQHHLAPVGRVAVSFTDLDEDNRREGGAGMLRSLNAGTSDVAVAPQPDRELESERIAHRPLYSWRLLAAVHPDHPLRHHVKPHRGDGTPTLSTAHLVDFPLLTSPIGHRSRDLLNLFEPLESGFTIELETRDTSARVSLGRRGRRVPIVAGDGVASEDYDNSWPALVDPEGNLLAHVQEVFWRTDLPTEVQARVVEFVDLVHQEAAVMRQRVGGEPD
jgi:DNA-binding transcriptional LysR family regulator